MDELDDRDLAALRRLFGAYWSVTVEHCAGAVEDWGVCITPRVGEPYHGIGTSFLEAHNKALAKVHGAAGTEG